MHGQDGAENACHDLACMVVAFSWRVKMLGECLTIHSPLVLFFFFFFYSGD